MAGHKYSRFLPSHANAAADDMKDLPYAGATPVKVPKSCVTPVKVHVYHVSGHSAVKRVNSVLRVLGTGAFHIGVEVYGQEWSFGFTDDGGTGVFCYQPQVCEEHVYDRSLDMGHTRLTFGEVARLIGSLANEWQGEDYDILRCNCCHFSDKLCRRLGVGPTPPDVTNLAGAGALIDDQIQKAASVVQTASLKAGNQARDVYNMALSARSSELSGLNQGADKKRSIAATANGAAGRVGAFARSLMSCGKKARGNSVPCGRRTSFSRMS